MCDCVCCAVATAAERARGSLYVIAREPNPRGGPSSSSARTRCLRHARGDASGDHPVKRTVIFCLAVESRVSVCAPQGRSTKFWAVYTRGTDGPPRIPPTSPLHRIVEGVGGVEEQLLRGGGKKLVMAKPVVISYFEAAGGVFASKCNK